MTWSEREITPPSHASTLLRLLEEKRQTQRLWKFVVVEPYDLFIRGEWNKFLPEFLAIVELAEEAAGADDLRLKDALTAWTIQSISYAWLLAGKRSQFAKLAPHEGRLRVRRFLELASSGQKASVDVRVGVDERIVGPGGVEDTTGDAVSPFGFKGQIDSATHFRSDRAQVIELLGTRSAIPALCRPCFGQSVCPENCPATSGECGKDFLGVYVRNPSKVFSVVTGSLGGHQGGRPESERRKEALAELLKTVGETGRAPKRNEIADCAARHGVGFTGHETGVIRRDLERRARQKNPT